VSGHELIVVRRGHFSYVTFGSARGGLVFEVGVGDFLVVFCGGGWTWRIVWQWY
jgi:hypothetical protein